VEALDPERARLRAELAELRAENAELRRDRQLLTEQLAALAEVNRLSVMKRGSRDRDTISSLP
jgi:cell division protein FtsB